MNIDVDDARDALMCSGAGNIVAIANLMIRMLHNAVQLMPALLKDNESVDWVQAELDVIAENKKGEFPYSLRPEIFEATRKLFLWAGTIEYRLEPFTYAPLTLAAQVLGNATAAHSERLEQALQENYGTRPINLVPHSRLEEIDHGFMGDQRTEIGGELHIIDFYSEAMKECRAVFESESA